MEKEDLTPLQRDLIFDIGMHRGEDTDYYLQKGFRVVGFEANPDLVGYCKTRFAAAVQRKALVIVSGAIVTPEQFSEGCKAVSFFRNLNSSVWGTTSREWAQRNEMLGTTNEVIEVPAVNFSHFLRQYGVPYYMKIDIEGSDSICLEALRGFYWRPVYLSMETEIVHFSKLLEEIELLKELGYSKFQAVQQADITRQVSPRPSREGRNIAFRFEPGSSGMFGQDLPNNWRDSEAIVQIYRRIFVLHRLFGNYSWLRRSKMGYLLIRIIRKVLRRSFPGWHDIHAMHVSAAD